MDEYNFSGRAFARMISHLPAETPIYRAFEGTDPGAPTTVWYGTQREHLIGWFSELAGPGGYNRKTRGRRAKQGYNSFQCAAGLVWLAEALGEDPAVVQAAADEASQYRHTAAQCGAVRRRIPWERIVELIVSQNLHTRPSSQRETPPKRGMRTRIVF